MIRLGPAELRAVRLEGGWKDGTAQAREVWLPVLVLSVSGVQSATLGSAVVEMDDGTQRAVELCNLRQGGILPRGEEEQ